MDPLTGNAWRPVSSGADHKLGTLPASVKLCSAELVLHAISFSVEEGVVGVIAMLSTSTASFAFSWPPTVSSPVLGDRGAALPPACFSINKSSCIVDVVAVIVTPPVLLAVLPPIDDLLVVDKLLLEKRLAALKSPINRRSSKIHEYPSDRIEVPFADQLLLDPPVERLRDLFRILCASPPLDRPAPPRSPDEIENFDFPIQVNRVVPVGARTTQSSRDNYRSTAYA